MKLKELPKGFDLYISGHIHSYKKAEVNGKPFIIAGSTIPTSLSKLEVESKRGITIFDGKEISLESINSRKVFFQEFEISENLKNDIEKFLKNLPKSEKKPIVSIKISGKIKEGELVPNISDIEKRYSNDFIIKINRNIIYEDFEKNLETMTAIKEKRMNPEEQGLKILSEIIKKSDIDINVEEVFNILLEGDKEKLNKVFS